MDEAFERTLRTYARYLTQDDPIDTNASLMDIGVDSLAMIQLLVDIEETFDVAFPDDMLTPEVFATPATLWQAVVTIRTENVDQVRADV
jgi:acyl carrier protein